MLADSDAKAGDVAEELAGLAKGTPLASALERVSRAVAEYDFDKALEFLRTIDHTGAAQG